MDVTLREVDKTVEYLNKQYGKGRWFAVFGGDGFNPDKPDIAHILKYLKDVHQVPIIAIQSDVVIGWGGVDKYIDYVRYVPTVNIPVLDENGYAVLENGQPTTKIHWGGLIEGIPQGSTGTYLGKDFVSGNSPILKAVVAAGGGPITLEELQYAHKHGVPIRYIRSEARFGEVNGRYGSVDEWAMATFARSEVSNSSTYDSEALQALIAACTKRKASQ